MRLACVATALALVFSLADRLEAQLAPLPHQRGASGLGLSLRRLPVVGGVLFVVAHPDDEDNGVLVKLRHGLGLRTGLLSLTRGDGGQNEIGPELFQALGVLRTEELSRVGRHDGSELFFSRAYEFGYSFSVEETFAKWGREPMLEDVVRVVRRFRPDVILTLPLHSSGGGQHHQAAAQLAAEAFRAAADAGRFPGQLREGLRPWQARKLYQARWVGVEAGSAGEVGDVFVDTSGFDPLLGMTWHQLGTLARASHRCQGMSQLESAPGVGGAVYALVDSEPPLADDGEEGDILGGVDLSLNRLLGLVEDHATSVPFLEPGLAALETHIGSARESYSAEAPHEVLAPLRAGLGELLALQRQLLDAPIDEAAREELSFRLEGKREDFEEALRRAHGVTLSVLADDGDVVPGQTFTVRLRLWNPGPQAVSLADLELQVPEGWSVRGAPEAAGSLSASAGQAIEREVEVEVGREARYSQPYWRKHELRDRWVNDPAEHHTLPWSPPRVVARGTLLSADVPVHLRQVASWRYEGRFVGGEKQKVVNVVPRISVALSPALAIIPLESAATPRSFRVDLLHDAPGDSEATVRLEGPPAWRVEPAEASVRLSGEGERASLRFTVTPPKDLAVGALELRAVALSNGQTFSEGYQVIAYDHVQERHLFRPATSRLAAVDVKTAAGVNVGYVVGVGDQVAEAIRQLGVPLTLLDAEDLGRADLSEYTTIVTGVRAYKVREDLKAHQQRLMRYVRDGGHLVVQYNKFELNQGKPMSPFTPYPAVVTRDRVSVEEAPLRLLVPDHTLLNAPNRISEADFAGWVQERGLYFLGARDERYTELLASEDPWPNNAGEKHGLLVQAQVGSGTWTYVGVGLFRQLPAGVPGAYRLLANLLRGRADLRPDPRGSK